MKFEFAERTPLVVLRQINWSFTMVHRTQQQWPVGKVSINYCFCTAKLPLAQEMPYIQERNS